MNIFKLLLLIACILLLIYLLTIIGAKTYYTKCVAPANGDGKDKGKDKEKAPPAVEDNK